MHIFSLVASNNKALKVASRENERLWRGRRSIPRGQNAAIAAIIHELTGGNYNCKMIPSHLVVLKAYTHIELPKTVCLYSHRNYTVIARLNSATRPMTLESCFSDLNFQDNFPAFFEFCDRLGPDARRAVKAIHLEHIEDVIRQAKANLLQSFSSYLEIFLPNLRFLQVELYPRDTQRADLSDWSWGPKAENFLNHIPPSRPP